MSYELKTATVADIDAIIALQEKIWEPTYRAILDQEQINYMFQTIYSKEALLDQMIKEQHEFVLVYEEGQLTGFASFSRNPAEPERFKLHKIYVLPAEQGKGAGRLLLDEVIRRSLTAGGNRLYLNVNRYNKARQFYERLGFQMVREEDIPIGPYWMNDFVLEKELVAH
ncbi:acetyltransferase (GNAT) family protein [Larkinella arboricola]|uniref:Acetyltransferase (GNAT) family protein n=1 Tax=Larkinella arboricola TaxID=643671 RepID=A0A327X221_LARAB|nr:GNAT family N-acetyltransferase [Larkinella arboricola]RAK00448.1 acetyltransferase (GNAT) family protein [Larkinella arboricola]